MACIARVVVIFTAICWSTCLSQNMEELLFASVREAVGEIKALSEKLSELQEGQKLLKESLDDVKDHFGELHDRMAILEGERDLLRDFWNNTCSVGDIAKLQTNLSTEFQRMEESIQGCRLTSVEQLSNLTVLFAKDECAEGSHGCSSLAVCEDTAISYRCSCLPGYSGDGFSCEDVIECSTGNNRCHKDAHCSNLIGNYTCTCLNGFTGDGFNCEIITCDPPSQFIPTFGCITPVTEHMKWEDARQNCLKQGGRLLQGITNQAELQQIGGLFKNSFSSSPFRYHVWLGLKAGKWFEGEDSINDVPSTLWARSQPDDGDNGCGYIYYGGQEHNFYDEDCSNSYTFYSLCQKDMIITP